MIHIVFLSRLILHYVDKNIHRGIGVVGCRAVTVSNNDASFTITVVIDPDHVDLQNWHA